MMTGNGKVVVPFLLPVCYVFVGVQVFVPSRLVEYLAFLGKGLFYAFIDVGV